MFTFRSVFFGFLGIFLLSGLSGFHDSVLGGSPMVGNQMPVGAFFYFMFLGLVWNGFWTLVDRACKANGRVRRIFALSGKELVVVLVATLVSCFPPTSGLFRYFHRQVMLPWHFLPGRVEWQKYGLLTQYLRPELFPAPWPGAQESFGQEQLAEYGRVYTGFFTGLASGTGAVPLWELPLGAWARPMLYWAPLLLSLSVALFSLQFLVHRQWAHHEQLSYPVAQVAGAFCARKDGERGVPDVFRNPLFWCGFVPVFVLLGLDTLASWYPQEVPGLQTMMPNLRSWWLPITTELPFLKKAFGSASFLNGQTLFFSFFGIAYFVSSEISLTVGLAPFLLTAISLLFYSSTGTVMDDNVLTAERSGAFVGYTIILLYTGRTYFKAVFARALGFGRRAARPAAAAAASAEDAEDARDAEDLAAPDETSVLAARLLVLAFAAFVVVLSWMCQSWLMALFYALLAMVMFLVISRIVCETGIPFIQAGWTPTTVLVSLLGPAAFGPHALTYLQWGTAILVQDPRESLMPYVGTGAKVADDAGLPMRKVFRWALFALAVALVVAFFSALFSIYNYTPMKHSWAARRTPTRYLDATARQFGDMQAAGVFEASLSRGPLRRLALAHPTALHCHWMLYGALAVVGLSALRFRFSKFPIHPVFFLLMGTYPCLNAWGSFLLGWFVKQLVVRFGGGGVYQKCKPVFVGLIAGELGIAGVMLVVGFVHYFLYGSPPPVTGWFLPG